MYQADSWEDMKDDAGNTFNIGKLEYKTKHGKKPGSFLDEVFPILNRGFITILGGQMMVSWTRSLCSG